MRSKAFKRLAALFCVLVLFITLPSAPAKAEEEEEGLTAEVSGTSTTVTYNASAAGSAMVVCACYRNNKLESVTIKYCPRGGSVTFSYSCDYHYRFFALEAGTLKPLCRSLDSLFAYDGPVDVPFVNDESEAVAAAAIASVASYVKAQQLTMDLETLGAAVQSVNVNGTVDESARESLNAQIDEAISAWDRVSQASGILYTAAGNLADAQTASLQAFAAGTDLSLREIRLMAGADVEWAMQVTRAYDAAKSNTKLKELGMMMGCDARRAYQHLQMAQDILNSHAYIEYGNCAEKWEKTYTGIKTGAKVGLFVCATIATAGGTAAVAAGTATVTTGQAVGIAVGGVDCALEITSTTGKILLGPGSKVVQRFEDKTKPISEACLLYSICTGGGDTLGEKLACLGDISLHDPDYQKMAYTYIYDTATQSFRLVAANCADYEALNKVKKGLLGEDKLTETVPPLNTVINQFLQGADYSPEKLEEILDRAKEEGIIASDATMDRISGGFSDAVAKDRDGGDLTITQEKDENGKDVTEITHWNSAGQMHGEQLIVDADGYIVSSSFYEGGELLCTTKYTYYREGECNHEIFDRDGVHHDPTGHLRTRQTDYPSGYRIGESWRAPQDHHANTSYMYYHKKYLQDLKSGLEIMTLISENI